MDTTVGLHTRLHRLARSLSASGRWTRLTLVAGLVIAATIAPPSIGQLAIQPAGKHSSIVTTDKKLISDQAFANLMKGLLINNGQKNAKDAKFVFQQCFGGGMLDDLQTTLGAVVPWVGGSAARWDQVSWGVEVKVKTPQDWWTAALTPELGKNQTLQKALENARQKDAVGVNGTRQETGQVVSANGGQNITLKDPAALSHHAILWAGLTNGNRFATDIARVNAGLQQAWAGTNFTIDTFYGNGTLPGTKKADLPTLTNFVNNVLKPQMNDNEQFFFYSSDHGSSNTKATNLPIRIPGRRNDIEEIDLETGELQGMQLDPDNQPTITIDYEDLTTASSVLFNGTPIGMLDPLQTEMVLDIPENLISLANHVEIDNAGDTDFGLELKDFSTGPIGTQIADVPEPGPLAALVGAVIAVASLSFRSHRRLDLYGRGSRVPLP